MLKIPAEETDYEREIEKEALKRTIDAVKKAYAYRLSFKDPYDWALQARPSQRIPEGNWRIWLILAGRGFGKTRTGAETLRAWVQQEGGCKNICLLGDNLAEVRRVMIEGQSGLLSVSPPGEKVVYHASKRQVSWPNGAIATAYGAKSYSQLRGPQFDAAWVDELAKFYYIEEVWEQLMLSLRLGPRPRVIVTTTPRPLPLLKKLLAEEDVVVTTGNTFENAEHLSQVYLSSIQKHYKHTRLGFQEIEGKILEDKGEALWIPEILEKSRLAEDLPPLKRIVVAIDPAVTCLESSDETGIIVAGLDAQERGYVLEDLSGKMSSTKWARKAVDAYHFHQADRIVAEVNNGGDLVEKLIRSIDPHVSYKAVRATRGKITRAEPISALYEQGKVLHQHDFPELNKQLLSYNPHKAGPSPDRLDALVWALTDLMLSSPQKHTESYTKNRIWRL